MTAYLVIREGSKWTDVFRLVDGESVTIGRAPTNAIVVKDERCSRNHAEVFQSQGQWTLRDLDSRNGTLVDGQRIQDDYQLQPATSFASAIRTWRSCTICRRRFPIRIGAAHGAGRSSRTRAAIRRSVRADDESVLETYEPTTITHRRGQSRFLEPPEDEDVDVSLPKVGRAAAKLCRLAFELAKATDVVTLANVALDGLFEGTQVDAGAVLLQARAAVGQADGRQPGSGRLAQRFAASLPSRVAVPVDDRDARRPGRAGPQRDGRQPARQPRQQGRDPGHERDLRADPPRRQSARA